MDGRAVSMQKGRVLPVSVKVTSVNERALVSSSILGMKKLVDCFENYVHCHKYFTSMSLPLVVFYAWGTVTSVNELKEHW